MQTIAFFPSVLLLKCILISIKTPKIIEETVKEIRNKEQ